VEEKEKKRKKEKKKNREEVNNVNIGQVYLLVPKELNGFRNLKKKKIRKKCRRLHQLYQLKHLWDH